MNPRFILEDIWHSSRVLFGNLMAYSNFAHVCIVLILRNESLKETYVQHFSE